MSGESMIRSLETHKKIIYQEVNSANKSVDVENEMCMSRGRLLQLTCNLQNKF